MSSVRTRTLLAASMAGVLAVGGLVIMAGQPASAAAGCRVDYTVASQWQGGFTAGVTVTNLGDPVNGWQLTWTFGAGQTITQAWNAAVTRSGAAVTATNFSYNATIATNAAVNFGFNGSWTGTNPTPTGFVLNGIECTGAIVTSSAPPSTTPSGSAIPRCANAASPPPPGPELVYVTNRSGSVTAYQVGSTGSVSATRSLAAPQIPDTYWNPWGITFDRARNAYVQSFQSDATTSVYPPGATVPCRVFRVAWPDSRAIAVDQSGYEYVMTGQAEVFIAVAGPGATGTPPLYSTPMLRQIPLDTPFNPWPGTLTMGPSGQVVAAVAGASGNAVQFFTGGPSAANTPIRVISGPHTGLGSCASTCDELTVTYSPFTGRLYVAVSQGQEAHINVYAGDASGDAAPIRVISGAATGLAGQVVTGIANSQVDGSIYVLAKPAAFSNTPGAILVFDRMADGNVAPLRSFTDTATGFAEGMGIAISR